MRYLCRISVLSYRVQSFKGTNNSNVLKNIGSHYDWSVHRIKLQSYTPLLCQRYFSTETEKAPRKEPELLYHGNLTSYIRKLKAFSLFTSGSALLMQPFIFMKMSATDNFTLTVALCSFFGMFAFTTPLLIHFITKKYATHVYYDKNDDKYIVKLCTLFLRTKEIKFTPEDVKIPDVTGPFTSCKIKNIPVFINEAEFKDLDHYKKIMGYDKISPLDLMMYTANTDSTDSKETNVQEVDKK